ncbi:MAG: 30S ribosome-binding factor RbfA [Ignavibacteriaceae bacterium]|jgi:ribosome-binding factor A|nr:30S ribosome-binding factor RbfA [Ignavibacteriaceae bacterium]
MSFRLEKISKLIKEEISLIFLHKIQDQSIGLVTVTKVDVSPDLRNAKIYLSVFPNNKRDSSLTKVKELHGIFRTELAARMTTRYVPELRFFLDDSADYVEHIDTLLKKIHENDNQTDK